ncbi:MAG: ABC transporter ATP-binding protein [Phycisphaerales bacterium]|nr:ABC transporter ATP-binding protein [Planctomycetota bacterium]MBL6996934.1 ABC transporter ATP-binding protein [Phycisphaerales bacterium]
MTDTHLNIKDVSVSFSGKRAVNTICIQVKKGKTTAIVGESGSGKSVTAMSVLGLLPKTATVTGTIKFENNQLLSLTEQKLRLIRGKKISMIFQEPMTSLNPVFTIGEQIEEVIRLHQHISRKGIRNKSTQMLHEVGIAGDRIHSYPHEFSGGMRQRAMIAMALANTPSLLIADEPTTALDATTSRQIMKLLFEAKQRREMSMLFITHDLRLVGSIADDISVMRSGNLVESGNAHQVLHEPKNEYTRALLACQPSIDRRKKRLMTVPVE